MISTITIPYLELETTSSPTSRSCPNLETNISDRFPLPRKHLHMTNRMNPQEMKPPIPFILLRVDDGARSMYPRFLPPTFFASFPAIIFPTSLS